MWVARAGHVLRSAAGALPLFGLASCYEDLDLDASRHPCAACRPCERCVAGALGSSCVVVESHVKVGCVGASTRAWFDSCGEVVEVVEQCSAHGECVEMSATESACRCRNLWQGAGCSVCPDHVDVSADCGRCLYAYEGADCEICPSNWDSAQSCAVCAEHWEGASCDICPGNWDASKNCADCVGHWDPASDCTTCRTGHVDQGDDCGTCEAGWELNAAAGRCEEVCGNGIVTASESCDDANAEPFDGCASCAIGPFLLTSASAADAPDISSARSGRFVVVWHEGGTQDDIWGRTFEPNGTPIGATFPITASVVPQRSAPKVVMSDDEHSVATWMQSEGNTHSVMVRRFDVVGLPIGDALVVNDAADVPLFPPSIAGTSDGRFAVAWVGNSFVAAKVFRADGVATTAHRFNEVVREPVAVAMNDSGGFVLAYVLSSTSDLFFRFENGSSWWAFAGQIAQTAPSVAATAGGSYITAWSNVDAAGYQSLRGIEVASGGWDVYAGFELAQGGGATDVVALSAEGDFAVAYSGSNALYLDAYERNGTPRFSPALVTAAPYSAPAIAATPKSGVIVAWSAEGTLLAQRFSPDLKPLALNP